MHLGSSPKIKKLIYFNYVVFGVYHTTSISISICTTNWLLKLLAPVLEVQANKYLSMEGKHPSQIVSIQFGKVVLSDRHSLRVQKMFPTKQIG